MADPVLHIKDSYYFEVPKVLYPYDYGGRKQFPDVWVSLDPEFQDWEFERLYHELSSANLPPEEHTKDQWHEWREHDHANFAKPYDVFLDEKYQAHVAKFNEWKTAEVAAAAKKNDGSDQTARRLTFDDYLKHAQETAHADVEYLDFFGWRHGHADAWEQAKTEVGNVAKWREDATVAEWDKKKIDAYNGQLSGKILIPQPFGRLRNLYEPETTILDQNTGWINSRNFGLCISKYMLIELVVGLILVFIFASLARRIAGGKPPKGKLWNLLEVFLVFIRDQIAKPVLGSHDHSHDDHGHAHADAHGEHHDDHGHTHKPPVHKPHPVAADPATRFLPLLWTIFFFVLGCNLMGMLPWAGAPTAAFAVTFALALVTFGAVVLSGMLQFGPVGFVLNQIPGMDLPWYMAIVIKPMILAIEILGLIIKHGVLCVRLFANIVAGHLVLLGILGFAFGVDAALKFSAPGASGWQWAVTAVIAVVASATFSCLELFVAFLQAYIFTFLTALFIGAAIHKH